MFLQLIVFFFQAEDGIRDLVRSRGLGDVYKRQVWALLFTFIGMFLFSLVWGWNYWPPAPSSMTGEPVSYTHLTLPTSDLV